MQYDIWLDYSQIKKILADLEHMNKGAVQLVMSEIQTKESRIILKLDKTNYR
jgi:hypothetical protein